MTEKRFVNRADAGRQLGRLLQRFRYSNDVVVLGISPGGMEVAHEVSRSLSAPLDMLVVRKFGAPGHEETTIGAVAPGGVRVFNEELTQKLGIKVTEVESIAACERPVMQYCDALVHSRVPALDVSGKDVVVVDDGIVTGVTMRTAIFALKQRFPRRIIIAVPVVAADALTTLKFRADEVACLQTQDPFVSVKSVYEEFPHVSDREVKTMLEHAAAELRGSSHSVCDRCGCGRHH